MAFMRDLGLSINDVSATLQLEAPTVSASTLLEFAVQVIG
jgi:hypothetical protein